MTNGAAYVFGSFRIDVSRRILLRAGEPVPITGKAFDTLLFLVEHRDHIVSKDEILEGVWVDATVEEANLTQTISVLRRALGERPGENKYIVTVSGRGYQFAAAVEQSVRDHPLAGTRSLRTILLGALLLLFAVAFGVTKLRVPGETRPTTFRLTALPGEETQPAFSPDGKQIAFAWNGEAGDNQDIYISLVAAGGKLRLTSHPASDSSPAWSPDGQYIAFHRNAARPGYFVIPAIGGPERLVAEVEPGAKSIGRKVAWSPDGKSLVITERPKRNAPRQIVAVSLTNGQRRVLTQPQEMPGDEDPAISPDGSQLAFVRRFVRLIVMRMDGTGERDIALAPGIRGVTWTADGHDVIYASMRTSGNNLWKVAASGVGAPELIAGVSGEVAFPSISSDGQKLVYSESRVNENIWRLNLDSDAPDTRLIYSTKSQFAPQISPDGRRIAFISDRSGSREVWISDQDGQNVRQLTFHGGAHVGTPRWSPDSRLIVYDMFAGTAPDIYQVAAEGGASRNLTNHPKLDSTPSYSRDGRWIYFSSNRSGDFQVWRMPAAGGEPLPLTRNGGAVPMESANGFVYYSRFGEDPGLLRVPAKGGDEIVAIPGVGAWGWWALSNEGVYFLERDRLANGVKLQFAPFSGQTRTVRVLPRMPSDAENVLSVDRMGQVVLLQQIDERFGDLVMVEGFR